MPNYKKQKKVAIIIGVCFGAVLLAGVIVFIVQTFNGTSRTGVTSTSRTTSNYKYERYSDPVKEKRIYDLGETYDNNGIKITFLKYEPFKDKKYDYKDMVRVSFKLKNNSDKDITFSILDFDCYVNDKTTDFPLMFESDEIKGFEDVPQGRYTERAIYVEAKTSDNIEIEYGGKVFRITK